jgi:TRAP-type C4-dicarboxylate transport system permease small subunit
MKRTLQLISILIIVTGFGIWFLHGAHTGWTTTETQIMHIDDITGIEYPEYISKLTFGIELPVISTVAALILIAISRFFKKTTSKSS